MKREFDFAAELADFLARSGLLARGENPAAVAAAIRRNFGGETAYVRRQSTDRPTLPELLPLLTGQLSVRQIARQAGVSKTTAHKLRQAVASGLPCPAAGGVGTPPPAQYDANGAASARNTPRKA